MTPNPISDGSRQGARFNARSNARPSTRSGTRPCGRVSTGSAASKKERRGCKSRKKQKTKRARRKQAGKETEASTEDSKDKVANYVPPVRGKVEARVRNLGKEYSQPTRELAVHAPALSAAAARGVEQESA